MSIFIIQQTVIEAAPSRTTAQKVVTAVRFWMYFEGRASRICSLMFTYDLWERNLEGSHGLELRHSQSGVLTYRGGGDLGVCRKEEAQEFAFGPLVGDATRHPRGQFDR